jgi:hypothetical protein
MKLKLLSFLASLFIRTLHGTLRVGHVRAENVDRTPQYILAFWHEHLLLMLHCRFRKPITVMSSQSKDGELMAGVFTWYGVNCARGSSTRGGGAALRELIRRARKGGNIAFTPDGPKGPPRVLKDGVIYAAQATALPIIPIVFTAHRKRRLRSWDRMIVPLPFSRAIYLYGEPILVPRDGETDAWRVRVEERMNELTAEAESNFEQLWRERNG